MKKTLAVLLMLIISVSIFTGCLELSDKNGGTESLPDTQSTETETTTKKPEDSEESSTSTPEDNEESTSNSETTSPENTENGLNCGTTESGERWFYAHVSEITSEYIAVIPYANTLESDHAGNGVIIVFYDQNMSNLEVNYTVCITYDGTIAISEPPQILSASSIELVKARD